MSREGEGRFAHGELIGALFGKLRLATRNIARGRAPEDTSKGGFPHRQLSQGRPAQNRSRTPVAETDVPGHPQNDRDPCSKEGDDQRRSRCDAALTHPAVPCTVLRIEGGHGCARRELRWRTRRFGIETSIIVPGAYTSGTNHFAHAGLSEDKTVLAAYETGPNATLATEIRDGFAKTAVPDADAAEVAEAIVKVVDMPFGKRPFRIHIDPADDGAEVVDGVADRVRVELLRNMGLSDLLKPTKPHQS